jgi:hypothetical protein
MEQVNRIKEAVSEYARKNGHLIPFQIYCSESELGHVIDIGTSIMCTKWGVGYPGGGFVQAVVDNDLDGAVGRSDSTCGECLRFFVTLKNSLGYVN